MFSKIFPTTLCNSCNADIRAGIIFCKACGRLRWMMFGISIKRWEFLLFFILVTGLIGSCCLSLTIFPNLANKKAQYLPTTIPTQTTFILSTPSPTVAISESTRESSKTIKPLFDNQRVIYAKGNNQNANRSIYIKYLDGSRGDVRVTLGTDKYGDNYPTFSYDGTSIAFSRCFTQKSDGCELFAENLASGEPRLILSGHKVMRPKWCSSSTSLYRDWVVFEDRGKNGNDYQDTASSLALVNVNTGELKKLTAGPSDWFPNWSPDCSQVVFTRYDDNDTAGLLADLMLLDLDTGNVRSLIESSSISSPAELSPAWSPNSQWIAFRKISDTNGDGIYRGSDDRNELWLIQPDGKNLRALITTSISIATISWSPDSKHIVVTTQENQMLVCDINGEIVLDYGTSYFHPTWSP